MSIGARRAELAEAISEALDDVRVHPYKTSSPAPFTGWLQLEQTDTEACTFGEVRLTVECQILVAASRSDFEMVQDTLAAPLIAAINAAGGRAVVVQPFTESVGSTTLYALSARFVTESEVA